MVVSTDGTSLVGIITLEDLFEELIKVLPLLRLCSFWAPFLKFSAKQQQGEIVDETDVRAEVEKKLHIAQVLRSLDQPIQLAIRASLDIERPSPDRFVYMLLPPASPSYP